MPKRIATQTIVLVRDGKRIIVKPNQSFDFSSPELKEIQDVNKDAVRMPMNESETILEVNVAQGGITNLDKTDANPDASVPAPEGHATSQKTGGAKPKSGSKESGKDDDL